MGWFFLILLCIFGLVSFIIDLKPNDLGAEWQHVVVKAELIYLLEDHQTTSKWLARFISEGEVFYLIVNCKKQHQANDMIDAIADDGFESLGVYHECEKQ